MNHARAQASTWPSAVEQLLPELPTPEPEAQSAMPALGSLAGQLKGIGQRVSEREAAADDDEVAAAPEPVEPVEEKKGEE